MNVVHPDHGICVKQYYTPTQKFMEQFPNFSLDRPTCFFTEAYYYDVEERGMRMRTEEEMEKLNQEKTPLPQPPPSETPLPQPPPSETPLPSTKPRRSLVPEHKRVMIKYRCTTDGVETCSPFVFVGRQDDFMFKKLIPTENHELNGIIIYIAESELPTLESEPPAVQRSKDYSSQPPLYGYGVLRYVINDHMTLDRVLFNVPSMLSVQTDNRHNQFCAGQDCKAEVVDILTVQSMKVDGKYLMEKVNLPMSKPRLDACQHHLHSYNHSYNYQLPWKRDTHYAQSDLRTPVASDFACLGTAVGATQTLEEQFAHAMANPLPPRERWQDFPIKQIITYS
jgi:hypothetical protein